MEQWQDSIEMILIVSCLPQSSPNIEFNLQRFCVIQNNLFPAPHCQPSQCVSPSTTPSQSSQGWSSEFLQIVFKSMNPKWTFYFPYCHTLKNMNALSHKILESNIFISALNMETVETINNYFDLSAITAHWCGASATIIICEANHVWTEFDYLTCH